MISRLVNFSMSTQREAVSYTAVTFYRLHLMEICVEIACSCWVVCKQAPRWLCFLLVVLDCLSLVSLRCGRISLSFFNHCRILWGDPVTGVWPYLSDHLPPDVAAVRRPVWGLPARLLWLLHRYVLHPVSSPLTLDCMGIFLLDTCRSCICVVLSINFQII